MRRGPQNASHSLRQAQRRECNSQFQGPLRTIPASSAASQTASTPRACLTMGLVEDFNAAAEKIGPVKGPNNDEMLELYGLFKQAKQGDNDTARPGLLDVKGKKKWDAWNKLKGMSSEDAMKAYIELVEKLLAKYAADGAAAPAPA